MGVERGNNVRMKKKKKFDVSKHGPLHPVGKGLSWLGRLCSPFGDL